MCNDDEQGDYRIFDLGGDWYATARTLQEARDCLGSDPGYIKRTIWVPVDGVAHTPTGDEREALERVLLTSFDYADIDPSVRELADAILAAGFRRDEVPEPQGEPSHAQEVEFPFTHEGVTLEQDDGGLWVTVENGSVYRPYWIGPKALAALRAASAVTEQGA